MTYDEFEPDRPLTPEQEVVVAKLSQDDIARIDEGLLSNCGDRWRKVAMVVGKTMMTGGPYRYEGVPEVFYSHRVKALVERGFLESRGRLDLLRYSEVRLPKTFDKQA